MSRKFEVRVSHACQSSPEQVFDAWLDPAKVRVWLAASLRSAGLAGQIIDLQTDPRPGGKFLFSDQRGEEVARHWGTYIELDRPNRIVFTWIVDESEEADPSRVTISIQPADNGGAVVTLVHEMDEAWIDYAARTETGWTRMLRASCGEPAI